VLDTPLYLLYNVVVKLHIIMTITTEDGGRQNMFAKEPKMYITEEDKMSYENETHNERAEILNGRLAMLGFVAAVVSYAITGKLFFGVF
jgi:hypothetical protein